MWNLKDLKIDLNTDLNGYSSNFKILLRAGQSEAEFK